MAVVLNEPALRMLLESPAGPVGRDLERRAVNIAERARQNAAENFSMRSGNLIRSIGFRVGVDAQGLYATVGCDGSIAPYAGYLEQGTQEHPITPHRPDGWLVSDADNPTPLTRPRRAVSHPGNQPMPFIRPALEAGRV